MTAFGAVLGLSSQAPFLEVITDSIQSKMISVGDGPLKIVEYQAKNRHQDQNAGTVLTKTL